jgi:hypothetical protein
LLSPSATRRAEFVVGDIVGPSRFAFDRDDRPHLPMPGDLRACPIDDGDGRR